VKLVITVPWGERVGGAENLLWTFLRHVDQRQITPTVVFLRPGPFQQDIASLGIETVVVDAGRVRHVHSLVRAVRDIARLLRYKKPDLVLNWCAKTQLYGALAACLTGMSDRVVWWQQGVPNGHWLDRLATLLPCRAVGCYSNLQRRAQESHWPHRQTFIVHPGIENPATFSEEGLLALRKRLNIPATRTVVGIVGRLEPSKGQHRFLRAIQGLRERGHDIHGLVVGCNAINLAPGYETRLRELAHELHLCDNLTFTGYVPEVGPYLQLMDISVNASMGEPFGLVLLEAMALGVPVVAFALGGPTEIVEPGHSGVLLSPDDEDSLVDALEDLVLDPGRRLRLGRVGYERYRANFSAKRMALAMERCLREVCCA